MVDLDIAKFFDCVNHDIIMSKLANSISDKKLLKLIRKFLQAGMMHDELFTKKEQGMPQGGPLSPLLSNIMLHDLDKELHYRGIHLSDMLMTAIYMLHQKLLLKEY